VSSAEEELLVQQGQLEPWHIQDDSSSNDNREESEDDREQHKRKRKRKHVVVGLELRLSYIEVAKANLIYAGCLQHISLPRMAGSLRQGAM
jgi:23S rRNA G2445 N2-methylase RlmL